MFKYISILRIQEFFFKYTKLVVLLIVILSLVISYAAWMGSKNYYDKLNKEHFDTAVDDNLNNIQRQMENYKNILRGGVGFFNGSDYISRKEWHGFVQALDIQKNYPGMQGYGFSIMLSPDEVAPMEQKMRAEGYESFSLKPAGKREQYSTILYLEPMDKRNLQAIGYDMFSELNRRTAMEIARDTATASISGKVTLVQEIDSDVQAGMLMYLPVYKKKVKLDTLQDRKKALIGFVYSAFRMNDLMSKIVSSKSILDFEIYDSNEKSLQHLMYKSSPESTHNGQYKSKQIIEMDNHIWVIYLSSTKKFDDSIKNQYPLLMTLGWLAVYFILLSIILALIKSKYLLQSQTNELHKLSQVVAQSPNSIVITNLHHEVEYVNAAFTEMTGYTEVESIGKNSSLLQSSEAPTKAYFDMCQALEAGKNWSGELTNIRKDGSQYIEDIVSSPIIQDDGNINNYVLIKKDITKEKELEQNLILAKEEAEKANKAKSEFLANMSHEIRTPLNGILGLTELIFKTDLNDKQRGYLEKSKTSSKALLHVINDILDYSKIEAGKLDLENNIFELDSVMDNIKDLFEYQINKKGLTLNINRIHNVQLIGDALRLTQILTNLVGNAIKFTEHGTIDIDVKIIKENENEKKLEFSIKDSGIGISKEVQVNLFKEFNQADNSITRKYGGTGLGLSISKHLAQMMNGEIWVESIEGKGSIFIFSVTFGKIEGKKTDTSKVQIKNTKSNTDSIKGARILLVEDNRINQVVAVGMLEDLNLHVEIANNGKEAVEMIESAKEYDLILMDLQMPIMDGFEATRHIKKINENIPIVALSAAVMQEDVIKTSEAKMSAHLAKPIDEHELIRTLLQWIKPTETKKEVETLQELASENLQTQFYGLDTEELKSRIGDKPKIVQKLLLNFCEDYQDVEQIFDISKIESNDFNLAIHALKGVSGNISLKDVYSLSKEIHDTPDIQIKKELTPKLIELIKKTVQQLKIQLSSIDDKDVIEEYKKEDVVKHLNEISDDIKHFRVVSQNKVELLDKMLVPYVDKIKIKELNTCLLTYKYKEADKILKEVYQLLNEGII